MTLSTDILASLRLLPVVACAALSTGVWAQSSVTLYGLFDIGIAHERGNGQSVTKMDGSGMHSGNRLGFRGTEDLAAATAPSSCWRAASTPIRAQAAVPAPLPAGA